MNIDKNIIVPGLFWIGNIFNKKWLNQYPGRIDNKYGKEGGHILSIFGL